MTTQPRLPGTLPTLPAAKARLREARASWFARRDTAEKFHGEVKHAKADVAGAALELEQVERLLLDAAAGTPEETAADKEHDRAERAVEKAENALAKVTKARDKADAETEEAKTEVLRARRELREVREGRRTR